MKLGMFVPALVLSAAACSAASTDGSAAGEGALASGGVCATLDYAHTMTAAQYYRQFATDAEAGDYLKKLIATGRLAPNSGPAATFQEITQDLRLVGLVASVFEGFKKAFPKETEGMTAPPRVALIKSDIVNAFALGPGMNEDDAHPSFQSPWLFLVHTALLERGGSDNAIRGVFAHEIGHLILRTFVPEVRQHVRTQYAVTTSEDGIIGETQHDDPKIAAHIEEIRKRRSRVGPLAELGLPAFDSSIPKLGTKLGASYANLLKVLIAQAAQGASAPDEVCKVANEKTKDLQAAQRALLNHFDLGDFVPRTPTAAEKAHLDELSGGIESELRTCLAPLADNPIGKASLMEATAFLNGIPEEALDPNHPDHKKLLDLLLDVEQRIDAEDPKATLVDRLLRAQKAVREELAALEKEPAFPIDQLRVYDFEDDADDAAVRVLSAIGDDPIGMGKFVLSVLPPDAQEACKRDVDARRPVPYGRFIDVHPPICWRYYHAKQFAAAISSCQPSASAAKMPAKGSGAASVIDKPPAAMIEQGYGRNGP